MIDHSMYEINQAWVAFKLNSAPIETVNDGDFNMVALMDAASGFMLATQAIAAYSPDLSELEALRFLNQGRSHKNQCPKELIVVDGLALDTLIYVAEKRSIKVSLVTAKEVSSLTKEPCDSFDENMGSVPLQ